MDLAYIFILLEIFLFFLSFQNYTNDEYIITISSYVLIFILTVISGFRYNVGRDFLNYEHMYLDPNNFRNLFTEPIWSYISLLFHNIGLSSTAWFCFTSFIINFFFISGIRKLSKNFYLSVAFYIAMPHLFLESFNIVRQFVAMSIIFRYSYLFFQKKYWKFIIVVLVASCFHKSAILVINLFFISLLKIPNLFLVLITLFCFVFRNKFLPLVIRIISSVSIYAGYIDNILPSESSSSLYAYVLLLVCLFIIICFRKPKSREINILKNLSLMSFCIYLLFYTFQAGQRIGFYVLPYFVLLVPYFQTKFKIDGSFITIGSVLSVFMLFTLKAGFTQLYTFRF